MQLSSFAIVRERDDAALFLDDPLIHCFAGNQIIVLAFVSRAALMDYFRVPVDRRITLNEWGLVVDRHLDGFKPIIEEKFARHDWTSYKASGQSYPKMIITLQGMQRSGYRFSMDVLRFSSAALRMTDRRFPPPWTVEETQPCFIVRDHNGQALAYVYCEDEPGRRTTGKLLTRDEARRTAANIAKLPGLLGATRAQAEG
jgi:hypothetical protein